MTNAIEIRGLGKKFSRFELGPLDMHVPAGAIYGFIGPNAAGKTTTIDLILGMGAPECGTIRVLDRDNAREAVAIKQQIGYVSPDLSFLAWGRVKNAIQFVRGFYPTWDHNYCEKLLESFRLSPGDRIASLSFGSRIKLSLLLALAHRPPLLILDEPTVGLDAISKSEMFAELLALVRDGEHTVLISSHNLSDVERFADHIGMIKEGKLLMEGRTDEIVQRFSLVDLLEEKPGAAVSSPGVWLVSRSEGRARVLVDANARPSALAGLRELGRSPVTLEELFVTLGKG